MERGTSILAGKYQDLRAIFCVYLYLIIETVSSSLKTEAVYTSSTFVSLTRLYGITTHYIVTYPGFA
jgi:hypothetical protein